MGAVHFGGRGVGHRSAGQAWRPFRQLVGFSFPGRSPSALCPRCVYVSTRVRVCVYNNIYLSVCWKIAAVGRELAPEPALRVACRRPTGELLQTDNFAEGRRRGGSVQAASALALSITPDTAQRQTAVWEPVAARSGSLSRESPLPCAESGLSSLLRARPSLPGGSVPSVGAVAASPSGAGRGERVPGCQRWEGAEPRPSPGVLQRQLVISNQWGGRRAPAAGGFTRCEATSGAEPWLWSVRTGCHTDSCSNETVHTIKWTPGPRWCSAGARSMRSALGPIPGVSSLSGLCSTCSREEEPARGLYRAIADCPSLEPHSSQDLLHTWLRGAVVAIALSSGQGKSRRSCLPELLPDKAPPALLTLSRSCWSVRSRRRSPDGGAWGEERCHNHTIQSDCHLQKTIAAYRWRPRETARARIAAVEPPAPSARWGLPSREAAVARGWHRSISGSETSFRPRGGRSQEQDGFSGRVVAGTSSCRAGAAGAWSRAASIAGQERGDPQLQ